MMFFLTDGRECAELAETSVRYGIIEWEGFSG
jgi:hypothetical protein